MRPNSNPHHHYHRHSRHRQSCHSTRHHRPQSPPSPRHLPPRHYHPPPPILWPVLPARAAHHVTCKIPTTYTPHATCSAKTVAAIALCTCESNVPPAMVSVGGLRRTLDTPHVTRHTSHVTRHTWIELNIVSNAVCNKRQIHDTQQNEAARKQLQANRRYLREIKAG